MHRTWQTQSVLIKRDRSLKLHICFFTCNDYYFQLRFMLQRWNFRPSLVRSDLMLDDFFVSFCFIIYFCLCGGVFGLWGCVCLFCFVLFLFVCFRFCLFVCLFFVLFYFILFYFVCLFVFCFVLFCCCCCCCLCFFQSSSPLQYTSWNPIFT